jgi:hypothetical protein
MNRASLSAVFRGMAAGKLQASQSQAEGMARSGRRCGFAPAEGDMSPCRMRTRMPLLMRILGRFGTTPEASAIAASPLHRVNLERGVELCV